MGINTQVWRDRARMRSPKYRRHMETAADMWQAAGKPGGIHVEKDMWHSATRRP
jgi:hypothetical protein